MLTSKKLWRESMHNVIDISEEVHYREINYGSLDKNENNFECINNECTKMQNPRHKDVTLKAYTSARIKTQP